MPTWGKPDPLTDTTRRIRDLERQVQELASAKTLQNATISQGGLEITDGGSLQVIDPTTGTVVGYIGSFSGGFGVVLTRPNGNVALQVFGGFLGIRDNAGSIVVSDDATAGYGLATPYIPFCTFQDIGFGTSNTTTSAAFIAMQWGDGYQQHPNVTASLLVQADAGTAGEVRMTVGGTQIGASVSIPAGSYGQFTIPATPWPAGTFVQNQRVLAQLEARVTSGSGGISVRGLGAWGVQS